MLEENETRDFALNEWELLPTRTGVALSLQTVRTKTAKLTIDRNTMAGELYILSEDPHELANQFDNPNYMSLREELISMLDKRPSDYRENQIQVGMA